MKSMSSNKMNEDKKTDLFDKNKEKKRNENLVVFCEMEERKWISMEMNGRIFIKASIFINCEK